MNKPKTPAGFQPKVVPAQQLTEEQKKAKIMQFVQQKREAFAINILCSLIQRDPENSNEDLVERSVTLADKLFETLYPLPETKETNN